MQVLSTNITYLEVFQYARSLVSGIDRGTITVAPVGLESSAPEKLITEDLYKEAVKYYYRYSGYAGYDISYDITFWKDIGGSWDEDYYDGQTTEGEIPELPNAAIDGFLTGDQRWVYSDEDKPDSNWWGAAHYPDTEWYKRYFSFNLGQGYSDILAQDTWVATMPDPPSLEELAPQFMGLYDEYQGLNRTYTFSYPTEEESSDFEIITFGSKLGTVTSTDYEKTSPVYFGIPYEDMDIDENYSSSGNIFANILQMMYSDITGHDIRMDPSGIVLTEEGFDASIDITWEEVREIATLVREINFFAHQIPRDYNDSDEFYYLEGTDYEGLYGISVSTAIDYAIEKGLTEDKAKDIITTPVFWYWSAAFEFVYRKTIEEETLPWSAGDWVSRMDLLTNAVTDSYNSNETYQRLGALVQDNMVFEYAPTLESGILIQANDDGNLYGLLENAERLMTLYNTSQEYNFVDYSATAMAEFAGEEA
tara:strand:- start:15348 stop:16781 length:1434 start_codon:yes stop_codon:yes gene_type:complete